MKKRGWGWYTESTWDGNGKLIAFKMCRVIFYYGACEGVFG